MWYPTGALMNDMCRSCLFEALKIAVRDAVSSNSYLEMNCYRYVGTFFRGGLLDWTWAELLAGAPGEVLDCAGGAVLGRGEAQVFNISTFIDFLIVNSDLQSCVDRCWQEPEESCWEVEDQQCEDVPQEHCQNVNVRVARRKCDDKI